MADISLSYGETCDETKPAGSRARSLGDDDIREFKRFLRERLAADHQFYSDETGYTNVGTHKKITLTEAQAADPSAYDDAGYYYLKLSGAILEHFIEDNAGNIIQLTKDGLLNDSVKAKTGDWMFSSVTTARSGWTNVSATYADKFIRIGAVPLTTGGADTHTHNVGTYAVSSHTHTIGTTAFTSGSATTKYIPTRNTSGDITSDATTPTLSGASASADNVPAYVAAVIFQKD